MQDSGSSSRRPYSWQTEEFPVHDHTKNYQAKKTQVLQQQQPNYPQQQQQQQSPQMVQPYQPGHIHQQQQQQFYAYGHYYCMNCRTQVIPRMVRKIAPAGWIVFAVLLISFFPLFWLGFFIKEDRRICPICGTRLG